MTANAQGYNSAPENYNSVPLQPVPSAQNPTLIPQWDPIAIAAGDSRLFDGGADVISQQSPSTFLTNNPRVPATQTITLTGSATVGDTAYIELGSGVLPNAGLMVSTLVVTGDTLTTIAQRLASLVNSNPILNGLYGVEASLSVVGGNPVITVYWPGPVGNLASIQSYSFNSASTITVGGTITAADVVTLTLAAAIPANGQLLTVTGSGTQNDVVSILFANPAISNGSVTVTSTVGAAPTTTSIATALAAAINAVTGLTNLGVTANANGANVWIYWPSTLGTVFVQASAAKPVTETLTFAQVAGAVPSALAPSPAPSETVTVGGTVTTGDVVSITVAGPFGTPIVVNYVVQGGDTTTSIATGLKAAANGTAALTQLGMVATSLANVLTLAWPYTAGSMSFKGAVSATATETFTLTGSPVSIPVVYVVQGGDTTTTIATALKNAINANVVLTSNGVVATSSAAIVTVNWNGGLLGPIAFTSNVSGAATETLTVANTTATNTALVGGVAIAGDVIGLLFKDADLPSTGVQAQITVTAAQTTAQMATALAAAINTTPALVNAGISAVASSSNVNIANAAGYPLETMTTILNGVETATVGGSVVAADTLVVTITDANLPGGSIALTYTVLAVDTTTTIATGIKLLINNSVALAAAKITATSSAAIVSITSKSTRQTTYARTNGASATLTLANTVTETLTITENQGTEVLTVGAATLAGGSGPIIPLSNFAFAEAMSAFDPSLASTVGVVSNFWKGKPVLVDFDTLSALVSQGLPIT